MGNVHASKQNNKRINDNILYLPQFSTHVGTSKTQKCGQNDDFIHKVTIW